MQATIVWIQADEQYLSKSQHFNHDLRVILGQDSGLFKMIFI